MSLEGRGARASLILYRMRLASLHWLLVFILAVRNIFAVISYILLFLQLVDTPMETQDLHSGEHTEVEIQRNNTLPPPPALDEECEMESTNSMDSEATPPPKPDMSQLCYPVMYPAYFTPYYPCSYPMWPGYPAEPPVKTETHQVVKPTAVHSKTPINLDGLVGMSKLSLGESTANSGPPSLSLKLNDGASRQSAFHANPSTASSGMNSSSNPIHAV